MVPSAQSSGPKEALGEIAAGTRDTLMCLSNKPAQERCDGGLMMEGQKCFWWKSEYIYLLGIFKSNERYGFY